MTPERYDRLCKLFHCVRDMDANEAARVLDAECADDPELGEDVRRMLASHSEGEFLRDAAAQSPDGDLVGQTIGRYQITAKAGEGGMATVYRAFDTRLNRSVALKLLDPHTLARPEARERFLREARAAAALEHPNICTVHEWDEVEGRAFLAMAYLPGRTVASLLRDGPLETDVAADIARQTARGLAAAHAEGVIHRDIKPGNLMLQHQPQGSGECLVKILDFGIARLEQEHTLSQPGLAAGSLAYMSPEQLTGREVDARTDLWSLGVTLYEMLAGRRPFDGETPEELGARITNARPRPLSELRDDLPPGLERIVERLLAKTPAERYDSAGAVAADLESLEAPARRRPPALPRWGIGAGVAAGLLVATLAIATREQPAPPTAPAMLVPRPVTSYLGKESEPALSPDGARVAFEWGGESGENHDIYVQRIGDFQPMRLTDAPESDFSPAWSPDGTEIAFLRQVGDEREIRVVPAGGGGDRLIRRAPGHGTGLDWSPRGDLLAVKVDRDIWGISLSAPDETPISYASGERVDLAVRFDPRGERIAYLVGGNQFVVLPVDGDRSAAVRLTHPEERLGSIDRAFTWTADGTRLVYHGTHEGPLFTLQIADNTVAELPLPPVIAQKPHIRGDQLVYEYVESSRGIWAVDLTAASPEPTPLIQSSRRDDTPRFSPDGSSIAFASDRSGSIEIWVADRDGRNARKLTSTGFRSAGSPAWSPDGRFIAFDSVTGEDNQVDIYVVSVEGGPARRLTRSPATDFLPAWSADGHWIYFSSHRADGTHLWKLPAGGGDPERVTAGDGWESIATPDGRYLYYSEADGGGLVRRRNLETGEEATFPELGEAGRYRLWAPSPAGIYYVDPATDHHTVRFLDFASGTTSELCRYRPAGIGPRGMDLSPDAKTLLLVQQDRDERDIWMVEGVE